MAFPILQREYNNRFYGGIFSPVGLRIFGFAFIAISQLFLSQFIWSISELLLIGEYNAFENFTSDFVNLLFKISNVGKPLIIISIFVKAFAKRENLIKTLIFTVIFAAIFYTVEILIYNHLLYPFLHVIFETYELDPFYLELVMPYIDVYIVAFTNLNVFLDTALCLLIYLFLIYEPKNIKGKKLIAYRSLTALPVAHIITTYIINVLMNLEVIENRSIYANALFTKGSLPTFFIFFMIVIFVKVFKANYHKLKFNTPHDEFIKTNRYAFYFSLTISIALAFVSLVELCFSFIPGCKDYMIGHNYWMFLGIPFVMMFNVNRKCNSVVPKIMHPVWMVFHYLFFALIAVLSVDTVLTVITFVL